ncbi:MAG: hypothetical protein VYD17_01830 [Pseudomonadota bacterium]|nr:hypothetical protein [Pseudomonadota bacterium]
MKTLFRAITILLCLAVIPLSAITTAAIKQRFADGPNRVFSGGPLVSGELHRGAEPDWQFVNTIPTIEMQLEEPPNSRRIWTVEHDGKLYVWSGYMSSTVGRLWKRWPVQAERNGNAIFRIEGTRYLRTLERIQTGEELDGIAAAISAKYPSRPTPLTRAVIERGDVWVFEAKVRQPLSD